MSLETIIKKYKNVAMFQKEQDSFKEEFFRELFDPYVPVDYSRRSPIFLNAIFEEENLPYILVSQIDEEKGIYWKIVCFDH